MPFVTKERREVLDANPNEIEAVGDMCYLHYKRMVAKWKANPRWTTAHEIYKSVVGSEWVDVQAKVCVNDDIVAEKLAWQVFFQLYVMPYELQKREEHGDI